MIPKLLVCRRLVYIVFCDVSGEMSRKPMPGKGEGPYVADCA